MTNVRIIPNEMEGSGESQLRTSEEESKCDLNLILQLMPNPSSELN